MNNGVRSPQDRTSLVRDSLQTLLAAVVVAPSSTCLLLLTCLDLAEALVGRPITRPAADETSIEVEEDVEEEEEEEEVTAALLLSLLLL